MVVMTGFDVMKLHTNLVMTACKTEKKLTEREALSVGNFWRS